MRKILAVLALLNGLLLPVFASAQDVGESRSIQQAQQSTPTSQSTDCAGADRYILGVPLGISSVPKGPNAFQCYVQALYKYILGLSVILAAIVVTYAGYVYLTSGGDPARVTHARELIIGALSGLALLILAATVLRFIGVGSSP